jgi:CheY-like chemotaxis protein
MSEPAKKVLLVDDDQTSTAILSMALVKMGLSVNTAKGGAEALSAMLWGRYDLIITDLIMPNVDGWEVIRNARQTQKKAKVIAISGGVPERLAPAKALEVAEMVGADMTLTKPINPNLLQRLVEAALSG